MVVDKKLSTHLLGKFPTGTGSFTRFDWRGLGFTTSIVFMTRLGTTPEPIAKSTGNSDRPLTIEGKTYIVLLTRGPF